MEIKLPQYSGRDNLVMLVIVPVFTLFINYNIFGSPYFNDLRLFLLTTLITGIGFCLDFILCGWIAVVMKNRFPREPQLIKRLTWMIFIYLLLTGLFLYALFQVYELNFYFSYRINETGFVWSYFSMGIINVFLTFLMEGISRYQTWKKNWEETEHLKKAYTERKLLGLKSQVNQYFLFDNLDSLSALIKQEDESAEFFLNEMSKVYRYMLRVDEEPLVTLDTEMKFIESYRKLLKARYGEGLHLTWDIATGDMQKWLPPLTLQVVVENILALNEISIANPLNISIRSTENNAIVIRNNIQIKNMETAMDLKTGLDNLENSFRLLIHAPMIIEESGRYRIIQLPLLTKHIKEEELV